jgi:hypothetical protein
MKKFVVEMDQRGTMTTYYEVEAESREDAIQKVADGEVESVNTEFTDDGCVTYDDTHEVDSFE